MLYDLEYQFTRKYLHQHQYRKLKASPLHFAFLLHQTTVLSIVFSPSDLIMWSPIYLILLLCSQAIAVWPEPQTFEKGSSVLWVAQNFRVTYNGGSVCWLPSYENILVGQAEQELGVQSPLSSSAGYSGFSSQSIVQGAIIRAKKALFDQNLVPWKLVARNELANFEPSANYPKTYIKRVEITQTGMDNANTFRPLAGQVDESYNLTIDKDGTTKISAVSSVGVLHALETFIQLFYQHSSGQGVYTKLAPVTIVDAPKFPHRGLNIDVSRNWYPIENILRTIDALSWNKFNRLHIHMTDAQSWPLDIPAMPELSRKGAYQTGLSYSPSDFQKIQAYAVERGIEIIVEFDMPGHTTSIGLSHPELITAFDAKPWDTYCAEPPCGSLKLNSSAVYKFLDTLFDDVLPRVKPYSA
jgi:hexosaminidase